MTRINTNIQSMVAARVFNTNQAKLNTAMTRLSTGLRVNSGKDDPAGLIASEGMRSDITGINSAITNAKKADSMVSTAEGALNEVSSLLNDLQGLVNTSASTGGLSADELSANQQQIDSILDSINRISTGTEFNGKKLLDGSMDYTTTGVTAAQVLDVKVNSARIGAGAATNMSVNLKLVTSGQAAKSVYGAAALLSGNTTLQVTGKYGSEIFTFGSAAKSSAVAAAVVAAKNLTGVSAAMSGTNLKFMATEFGADPVVSVTQIANTAGKAFALVNTAGKDAVVSVNGVSATANGQKVSVRSSTLDVDLTLATDFIDGPNTNTSTFTITGGGNFSIGQTVGVAGIASLGLASMATGKLGRADVGYLGTLASGQANAVTASVKNFSTAQRVIDSAISQVATLRGRLGAFQKNTLGSTMNSLQVALENTSAAEDAIRDADFAAETANMTRQQIMVQAGTATLRMANQAPQTVLALMQ